MTKFYLLQESTYYLNAKMAQNNAKADGVSENVVSIYCLDDDYYPARGIDILVRVSGNAVIKQTNQAVYHGFTDVTGSLLVSLINKTAEDVTVTVEVAGEASTRIELPVTFIENNGALAITSVKNINHTFKQVGEPTIAWAGASFIIQTSGGSGEISWKVTQSSAEVAVDSSPDGSGVVTLRGRPRQICEIEATDLITEEKVKYNFQILSFISVDKKLENIYYAESNYGNNMLRIDECNTLFSQWGNLSKYIGWDLKQDYWTNDIGVFNTTLYNFSNGNTSEKWNFFNSYTPYKIGAN